MWGEKDSVFDNKSIKIDTTWLSTLFKLGSLKWIHAETNIK